MKSMITDKPNPNCQAETESFYRTALDNAPDWLQWLTPDGRYQYISPACEAITGYAPEEFIDKPELALELVHPDDRQRVAQHRQQVLQQADIPSEFEFRMLHRNGEQRWISHKCRPIYRDGAYLGQFSANRDITKNKEAEEELRLSHQTILALMNAPTDIMALVDPQYKIVHVNQTLADRFSQRVEDMIGKSILDVIALTPELACSREAVVRQVFQTGQPVRQEDVGVTGVFDNVYYPIFDMQGNVRLVAAMGRDITKRKQMEDELRQSYQTIQALLNAPSDIAVVLDLDGKIQMVNETLACILKQPASDLIGHILWDYFPPEITQFRKSVFERVKQTRIQQRVEDRVGSSLYDSVVFPILDDNGIVSRIAILARDISERVRAQEALSQREAMLRLILQNAPVLLFVYDKTGKVTFADGIDLENITTLTKEIIGANIFNILEPNSSATTGLRQALAGQDFSTQITTSRGYTFETRVTPLRNSAGEIVGGVCVGVDITENKKVQEELHSAKDELQAILEGVADAVIVSSADGRIAYANQGAIQTGDFASLQELINLDATNPAFTFYQDTSGKPLSQQELLAMRKAAVGRAEPTVLRYTRRGSSEVRWISIKVTPLYGQKGELQHAVSIFHDITQLKQTQARLEAAQMELEDKITERTAELNFANQELIQRIAERQRAAAHAETLGRVAARLNAQIDLRGTLQVIWEETTLAVKYPICSVFLYDEGKDELYMAAPERPNESSSRIPATSRALYQRYLDAYGQVLISPDGKELPEMFGPEMVQHLDIRTLVSIPLMNNEQLIGCLNVACSGETRIPDAEELNLLKGLADQASIAISNARLFDQVSESQNRLRMLSEKLVETQEIERRELARELHDEIGQLLTSLRLNLDLAVRSLPADRTCIKKTERQLSLANETAAQLLSKIREISLDLRPTLLDDLGLLPALLAHFERFNAQTNVQVRFKHSKLEDRYSNQMETVAFRLIQEALTNVARHAQVSEASVRLWADQQFLRLQVEDQGIGFDPQSALFANQSSGLAGMQERVALCNGQLEIESEPGAGTCITAEIPLQFERQPNERLNPVSG